MSKENINPDNEKVRVLYKNTEAYEARKQFSRSQIKRRREAIDKANEKSLMLSWKKSDSIFFRTLYKVINGIWIAVIAVGSFIAWLISFLLF